MPRVYVSIGSNIDREANVCSAVQHFRDRYPKLIVSAIYESNAVGFSGADFYNLVVAFDTTEEISTVVSFLRRLEALHGRERQSPQFSSRTLDLDLLLYGDAIIDDGQFMLPRADITRYAFVLAPLAEIAGEEIHPVIHRSYARLWADFSDQGQQLLRIPAGL